MTPSSDHPNSPDQTHGRRDTLPIRPKMNDEAFQQSFGTALFRPNNTLGLHFPDTNQTLEFDPPSVSFLGRFEEENQNLLNIDLTPYQARSKGVSRLHAVLHRTDYNLTIEDARSYNGTYLNGVRMIPYRTQLLRNGDELLLATLLVQIIFM
jgi:hypothetical protein